MTETTDIELIVREVLRRLMAIAEGTDEAAAQSDTFEKGPASSLTLTDHVITLSALDGKLNGVKQLVVRRKAIVTPAVRDELKRRGVGVVRENEHKSVPTLIQLLAALHGPADAANPVRSAVSQAAHGVEWLECQATQSLAGMVRDLSNHIQRRNVSGLLLTSAPLVAAAVANRDSAMRAAVVNDMAALDEAIASLGANLFVVDPARVNPFVLKTIVGRIAAAVPVCPPELLANGAH